MAYIPVKNYLSPPTLEENIHKVVNATYEELETSGEYSSYEFIFRAVDGKIFFVRTFTGNLAIARLFEMYA